MNTADSNFIKVAVGIVIVFILVSITFLLSTLKAISENRKTEAFVYFIMTMACSFATIGFGLSISAIF